MSFAANIDFRHTANTYTDPNGYTYCLADLYPTTRGGLTFGWSADPGDFSDGNGSAADVRLQGDNGSNDAIKYFRLDLPALGAYSINLAAGGPSGAGQTLTFKMYDSTDGTGTVLLTVAGTTSAGQWVDAAGNFWSSAAWGGSNVAVSVTTTGTSISFKGTAGFGLVIATLSVTQPGGGAAVALAETGLVYTTSGGWW